MLELIIKNFKKGAENERQGNMELYCHSLESLLIKWEKYQGGHFGCTDLVKRFMEDFGGLCIRMMRSEREKHDITCQWKLAVVGA